MESKIDRKPQVSEQLLKEWLTTQAKLTVTAMNSIKGDAGFRRYYRIFSEQQSYVAMDASASHENCHAFIAIAQALRKENVCAPEIYASDVTKGYILLTDFGDLPYIHALTIDNAESLYGKALQALAKMQSIQTVSNYIIPPFTDTFMWQEWAWHKEWVMEKLLKLNLPLVLLTAMDEAMAKIINQALKQPQVFMHRDYHSANLMVVTNNVGVLDFQDAFIGPVTYDLVSLLRDCYVDWPAEKVTHWILTYKQALLAKSIAKTVSNDEFIQWVDWMGVQRHLKAMLTFARKKVRDQDGHYLNYLPRTLDYLQVATHRYPELHPLNQYLKDYVKPALTEQKIICAP